MKKLLLALIMLFNSLIAVGQTVVPGTVIKSITFSQSTAGVTVAEVSDFTAVADTAGSLAGTYFKFYNPNAVCYAPWFKVSGTGTAPTVTGCTAVEVDISTNDANTAVASAARTVLNAAPYTTYFTITGATTHVIVTSVLKGAATDGNVGTSGFSVSKTQGVSGVVAAATTVAGVMGYRICNNAVNTSTWLAVSKSALDPELAGVRLAKGQCLDCPSCTKSNLDGTYVSSQAASNGYSVVQFKN